MFKQKNRGAVSTVMVAVAVILLAGCDAGIESVGPALASLVGSAYATQRDPVADSRFMVHAIAIENRHFDIYNAYRSLFDSVQDLPQTGTSGAVGSSGYGTTGPDRAGPVVPCPTGAPLMADN